MILENRKRGMSELSDVADSYWHPDLWRDHPKDTGMITELLKKFRITSAKQMTTERKAFRQLLREQIMLHG